MENEYVDVLRSPDDISVSELKKYDRVVFIGGGISNCPNWQETFIERFKEFYGLNLKVLLVNPRREGDLARVGVEAEKQIIWERAYLQIATHIVFWFPKESICPITLFELGQWATKERVRQYRTIIGVETGYQREFDLRTQIRLVIESRFNYAFPNSVHNLARSTAASMHSMLKEV